MTQRRNPAAFMRDGTGKALMFDARDLPADRAPRDDPGSTATWITGRRR